MSEQRARAEIERAFPKLSVREITFLGAGVDSEVYLVNGDRVFRFPKRPAGERALRREIAVLQKLARQLPVATPSFLHIGRLASTGLLFAGYRLIPGEPLTSALFSSLAPSGQERVIATLAAVLQSVHSFPVADAVALGVEQVPTREWVEARWSHGRATVLPLLSPPTALALASLIEHFSEDDRNFEYTPCLLYADFAPEHVLFDRDVNEITGIIDWGDLAIGDPDFDLLYLYQDYGEDFVRRLLTYYPHLEPARLLTKLRVFTACDYVETIAVPTPDRAASEVGDAVAALGSLLRQQ